MSPHPIPHRIRIEASRYAGHTCRTTTQARVSSRPMDGVPTGGALFVVVIW